MFNLMWAAVLALAAGNVLVFYRWRLDLRKREAQIRDLEARLAETSQTCREMERAIDMYYIPHWQDAAERLGGRSICTCPPYAYRSTCGRHSPQMRKRQIDALREIEQIGSRAGLEPNPGMESRL